MSANPNNRASKCLEPVEYTELELVIGMRDRDSRATEYVYKTYSPRMLAVARRILRCDQEAQDAVQEAFVSAIQSINGFNCESRLGTWLHRIVVNAALMRLRRLRTRSACHSRCCDMAEAKDESNIDQNCGYKVASSREISELVRQGVDQLPESYRQIVYLRDLNETDTATTAKLLCCTEANVKTRLHRARIALRQLIAPVLAAAVLGI